MPIVMQIRGDQQAMSIQVQEIQQGYLDPKQDLSDYTGQWVALRDGKVVASALDSVSLLHDPAVLESDILMPVPAGGSGIFVA
jgi:hypothetical protein